MKKLQKEILSTEVGGSSNGLLLAQDGTEYVTDSYRMLALPSEKENGVYEGKKKVEKKFPDIKRAFPQMEATSAATVNVEEFAQAIKFIGVIAKKDVAHRVFIEFRENEIAIIARDDEEMSHAEVSIEGVPVPMVPCCFMLRLDKVQAWVAALKREKEEFFLLEFYQKNYPVLFSTGKAKYLVMVMGH